MADPGSAVSMPVGAVIAYAGTCEDPDLEHLGWLVCNGAPLVIALYPELYAAIGTANGSCSTVEGPAFNLPDLRGRFLRGADLTGTVDPGPRTAPPGSSGSVVGTFEDYATGYPREVPFTAAARTMTNWYHSDWGTDIDMLVVGSATKYLSDGGGDAETRPVNGYVKFLIKAVETAPLPPAAVVPYAGSALIGAAAQLYLTCNSFGIRRDQAPELYDALGTNHGTVGNTRNLPDYRGLFLRGVNQGAEPATAHDPDVATRLPGGAGAPGGDVVGSIQLHATGRPQHSPFSVVMTVGDTSWTSDSAKTEYLTQWNPDLTSVVELTAIGGDLESRPANIGVDFCILTTKEANGEDYFPIGAMIAFAGDPFDSAHPITPPPPDQWLLCDGSSLGKSDPRYATLFAAIDTANGSADADHFNLPDYRGLFLRGTDHGTGNDPEADSRKSARPGGNDKDQVGSSQPCATARPTAGHDITTTVAHLPIAYASNIVGGSEHQVPTWDDTVPYLDVNGGDVETRPRNVCAHFYIKYALAKS